METPEERVERIRSELLLRALLHDHGTHDREIVAAIRDGTWIRVARGVYAPAGTWQGWYPEERHIARAVATDLNAVSRRPIFSHLTASVILGLPGYRLERERVHVVVPGIAHPRSTSTVIRHVGSLADGEVAEIAGLHCTSLTRTLADVARTSSPEQSAVCLDAGLQKLFGRAVVDGQEEWRAQSLSVLESLRGRRGARLAKRMIRFADGRAESPAESLSRLQLQRLGYAVEIQVEVPTPHGTARIDFEFIGLRVFGEVDGAVKYLDAKMLSGMTPGEAVLREKHREDWVSGSRGARFVRWGFRESESSAVLGARLRVFGVHPLSRSKPRLPSQ